MLCRECQHELPDNSRFCGFCGAKLIDPPAPEPRQSINDIETTHNPTVLGIAPVSQTLDPINVNQPAINDNPLISKPFSIDSKPLDLHASAPELNSISHTPSSEFSALNGNAFAENQTQLQPSAQSEPFTPSQLILSQPAFDAHYSQPDFKPSTTGSDLASLSSASDFAPLSASPLSAQAASNETSAAQKRKIDKTEISTPNAPGISDDDDDDDEEIKALEQQLLAARKAKALRKEKARQAAEEAARREAEEAARREAEEAAARAERERRAAEEKARIEAENQARRDAVQRNQLQIEQSNINNLSESKITDAPQNASDNENQTGSEETSNKSQSSDFSRGRLSSVKSARITGQHDSANFNSAQFDGVDVGEFDQNNELDFFGGRMSQQFTAIDPDLQQVQSGHSNKTIALIVILVILVIFFIVLAITL